MSFNREYAFVNKLAVNELVTQGAAGAASLAQSATQQFPLGTRKRVGMNEYIYVKASANIAIYEACLISEDGTAVGVTTTTAAAGTGQGKMVCVPQTAIASGSFGWGAIYGGLNTLKVLAAANAVKFNTMCTTDVAGVVDDAPVNAGKIVGLTLEETITTAAAAYCMLTYPSTLLDAVM